MPTPTTIAADLVEAGIGLPPVWLSRGGEEWRTAAQWHEVYPKSLKKEAVVDLSDPQTAFGVSLKLDDWEIAGGIVWNGFDCIPWSEHAGWRAARGHGPYLDMVKRIEEIGRDHRIRRRLGWPVTPGTLADLEFIGGAWHLFPEDGGDGDHPPAIFGNQEAVEAYVEGQCRLVPDLDRALDTAAVLAAIDKALEAAKGAK
jgi:hypothetical protein